MVILGLQIEREFENIVAKLKFLYFCAKNWKYFMRKIETLYFVRKIVDKRKSILFLW